MTELILYRLEYYPRKGTFHSTPWFSEFMINDGWIVIDYQQNPDLLLSFTDFMHEAYPELKQGIDFPVTAEEVQANWILFKYRVPFTRRPKMKE